MRDVAHDIYAYTARLEMTNIMFDGESIPKSELPIPSGWRILVGSVKVDEKTSGGIILTGTAQDEKKYGRFVAKVLAVGPECYNHEKFQGGVSIKERVPKPWATVGNYVVVGQYAGQQIPVYEDDKIVNLKLLNDDEVLATLDESMLDRIAV